MKKAELIKLLEQVPDDADIGILEGDDILGDYSFNLDFGLYETTGRLDYKGNIWASYANNAADTFKVVKVWEIL